VVSLVPVSAIVPAAGGARSFVVNGAAYTTTETLDWVTITSGATGNAGGTVNYTVAAYTVGTQPRSGVIRVNGVPFTITQNPPQTTCTYTLNPSDHRRSGWNGIDDVDFHHRMRLERREQRPVDCADSGSKR
jgi:hypothetical protein